MVLNVNHGETKTQGPDKDDANDNPDFCNETVPLNGGVVLNEKYYQEVDVNSTWCQLILLILFKVSLKQTERVIHMMY